MVQESWLDTVCTTEKLKPRSAIKGTLRGVRGGENSPYSITQKTAGVFVLRNYTRLVRYLSCKSAIGLMRRDQVSLERETYGLRTV